MYLFIKKSWNNEWRILMDYWYAACTHENSNHIKLSLMKIKLNNFWQIKEISRTFTCQASITFNETVPQLASILKSFVFFPGTESTKTNLPITLRANYHNILNNWLLWNRNSKTYESCSSVSNWSEYKKANTLKYLISVSPDRLINFISMSTEEEQATSWLPKNLNFWMFYQKDVLWLIEDLSRSKSLLNIKKCTLIWPSSVL